MGLGFPKKVMARLRYVNVVALNGSAGALQTYKWKCNGMYDPDQSSTGHQPLYFDNYMAIYDHYTVIGSKAIFKIVSKDGTSTIPFRAATYIDDDTSQTAQTIDAIAEQNQGQVVLFSGGDNNPPKILTQTWGAVKWFGGDPLANDNLQGSASADPQELSFFNVAVQACDAVSSCNTYINVEIEYLAVFDEIKDQAQN